MNDVHMSVNITAFGIRKTEKANYRRLPETRLTVLLLADPAGAWLLPSAAVRGEETVTEAASRLLEETAEVREALLAFSDVTGTGAGGGFSSSFWTLLGPEAAPGVGCSPFDVSYRMEERVSRVTDTRCESEEKWRLALTGEAEKLTAGIRVIRETGLYNETVRCFAENCEGIGREDAVRIARAAFQLRHSVNDTPVAFKLMPESFTLTELQKVYETILDTPLLMANFRRKMAPYVLDTGEYAPNGGHHPSRLYRRNIRAFMHEEE